MAKKQHSILNSAIVTLQLEGNALLRQAESIDERFEAVVRALLRSKGRLVVTGIGKSGNIAQKIVATLVSTGQPALFMHAADAIHGDLGTIQKHDVCCVFLKAATRPK
jgi:arabinose-5-phosphate isomerase